MNIILLAGNPQAFEVDTTAAYITGAAIALGLLAFLLYTLIKPEKF